MKNPAKASTNTEGANCARPSALAALLEVAAGSSDVVEGGASLVESPYPNGVMVMVELFLHWSAGNTVASLLKVISAHYLR